MRRGLALVVAVGCRFDAAGVEPDDRDPPIDATGEVPPDADPDVPDGDGDGVPDSEDVCPGVSDPGQHDEDGDGAGDACDDCPHLFGPQEDVGEEENGAEPDGVGDACDPNPKTPGDRFVLFDGFGGAALSEEWTVSGPAVTLSGDGALVTGDLAEETRLRATTAPASTELVTVSTELQVASYLGGDGYRYWGLLWGWTPGTTAYLCDIADQVADVSPAYLQLVSYGTDGVGQLIQAAEGSLPIGAGRLIAGDVGGEGRRQVRCESTFASAPLTISTDPDPTIPQGQIGLRSYGVTLTVDWIVAIASPATSTTR
jgi:hypothetical protein